MPGRIDFAALGKSTLAGTHSGLAEAQERDMEAGSSKDRYLAEASTRREHRLRNEVSRVCIALGLARSALASGDRTSLDEMLAEAEDAARGCCEALGSRAAPHRGLDTRIS